MIQKFVSRLDLKGARVDRENGLIKGVSLIALGDARGHGKAVDEKTLDEVIKCAREYGDGLRVKFNPNTFQHGAGSLAGRILPNSLRKEDGKAVGDLKLYRAFSKEAKEYLYELAEETPGNIGLSIEFSGDDEDIKGEKFARCTEIYAATIVDLPAANPTGLFSVGDENKLTTDKDGKQSPQNTTEEEDMKPEDVKNLFAMPEFKAGLKQLFAECMPPPEKSQADKEKEEMAAAGVTDTDDDKTKETKLAAYRASQDGAKKVGDMTVSELSAVIGRQQMQFFRQTGGKPTKTNEGDGSGNGDNASDPFERRVQQHMEAGARNRGIAIQRARRDAPAEYNAFMAKQHPNTQTMTRK